MLLVRFEGAIPALEDNGLGASLWTGLLDKHHKNTAVVVMATTERPVVEYSVLVKVLARAAPE